MIISYTLTNLASALLLILLINNCAGEFTEKEQKALKKFKEVIDPNILYKDYMNTDTYLLTWLKARNMNINAAHEMLKNAIHWRKQNKIDNLIDEPLKCNILPALTDSIDKNGKPVLIFNLREWNIRKIILAGKTEQFFRCSMRFFEIMTAKGREINKANGDDESLAQFTVLVDLKGYNLRQHGCVACIPTYLQVLRLWEANYPQVIYKMFLINMPTIFEALLQLSRGILSKDTQAALNVYGFQQDKWQPVLHNHVDPDQLPANFGGNKSRSG